MKKINWKQPKYVLPIIALPFVIMIGYFINNFKGVKKNDPNELTQRDNISTDLGTVNNSEIKGKTAAYEEFFDKRTDGRTRIESFETESDSAAEFSDNLSEEEKRYIDSLNFAKEKKKLTTLSRQAKNQQVYYSQNPGQAQGKRQTSYKSREDEQYERSMKMLEALNNNSSQQTATSRSRQKEPVKEKSFQEEQMSLMRQQMMLMDSIEKSKNPELRAQAEAEERMKKQQDELEMFLNSTLKVSKESKSGNFNSIYKVKESSFIKAVIDENIKGYLGSRIRIRLLEDIYVGNLKIEKGNYLYALISGFSLQRVNLNIVSVMYQNEILPINLNIYDVDGMEGLYVPASAFREMTRTMGQNVVQGSNMNMANADFFTNALTSVFQSTSQTVAALIRKNKVKVKYNSYVYLVDNKELQKKKQNIYKTNSK